MVSWGFKFTQVFGCLHLCDSHWDALGRQKAIIRTMETMLISHCLWVCPNPGYALCSLKPIHRNYIYKMKDSGGKFIHLFVLYHFSASITVKRRPIAREYFITHEEVLREPPFCLLYPKNSWSLSSSWWRNRLTEMKWFPQDHTELCKKKYVHKN